MKTKNHSSCAKRLKGGSFPVNGASGESPRKLQVYSWEGGRKGLGLDNCAGILDSLLVNGFN